MIEKFQASLLGYAIGDALAAPVEDTYRSASDGESPVVFYTKASFSHPLSHLDAGQFSDETQIMILLASSFVEMGSFVPENVASRLVDWYQLQKKRSEWRFPGNTLVNTCRKLASGIPWNQAGFFSAGINAVCRTLPYALAYYNSPTLLKNAIDNSCRMTHTDPKVAWVSYAFASVIEMGLRKSEFSVKSILNKVCEKTQPFTSELIKKCQIIREGMDGEPRSVISALGNSGYCMDAFSCALYWFLKAGDNFDALVVCAANCGGDNDSIAAMAGAMYGAWFGYGKMSQKWLEPLEKCREIKQLGCDVYRISTSA